MLPPEIQHIQNCREKLFGLRELADKPFNLMLESLLEESGKTRSEIKEYLVERDFYLGDSTVDRYFNGLRLPDESFLELFSECIGLNEDEMDGLLAYRDWYKQLLRRKQKREEQKNNSQDVKVST